MVLPFACLVSSCSERPLTYPIFPRNRLPVTPYSNVVEGKNFYPPPVVKPDDLLVCFAMARQQCDPQPQPRCVRNDTPVPPADDADVEHARPLSMVPTPPYTIPLLRQLELSRLKPPLPHAQVAKLVRVLTARFPPSHPHARAPLPSIDARLHLVWHVLFFLLLIPPGSASGQQWQARCRHAQHAIASPSPRPPWNRILVQVARSDETSLTLHAPRPTAVIGAPTAALPVQNGPHFELGLTSGSRHTVVEHRPPFLTVVPP